MFLNTLFKYIRGVINFTVIGFFGETFISKCNENKIPIWNISPTKEGFSAFTYAKEYRKMRPIAKKTGVRIRVAKKKGLPFKIWLYRKRKGILIGFILFWIMLFIFSNRVWRIEVKGNNIVDTKTIVNALEEIGIKPGVSTKDMDSITLEAEMLLKVRQLSFIAINFRGSTVYIEVTEVVPPPVIIDDDTKPQNIISGYDGQIIRVEAYEGQPMVKKGDTVLKGDILISGITEDGHQNALIKKARGKVFARTREVITSEVSLMQTDYVQIYPIEKIPYIEFFGLEIPLKIKKNKTDFVTTEKTIKNAEIFENTLPIGIGETINTYWQPLEIKLTQEQAKDMCIDNILKEEQKIFADCEIISKTMNGTDMGGKFVVTATYEVTRDIALEAPILRDMPS